MPQKIRQAKSLQLLLQSRPRLVFCKICERVSERRIGTQELALRSQEGVKDLQMQASDFSQQGNAFLQL